MDPVQIPFVSGRSQMLLRISVLKNFANIIKKDLNTDVFLLKLQNIKEHLFSQNIYNGCFDNEKEGQDHFYSWCCNKY